MKKTIGAKQLWKCNMCLKLLDETYQIDHKICVKDGGTNEENNLQALCPNCHAKKTSNDMKKPKVVTPKPKVVLPEKWAFQSGSIPTSSMFGDNAPMPKAIFKNFIINKFPDLAISKFNGQTKFDKFTINELKLIAATIEGEAINTTKKDLILYIKKHIESIEGLMNMMFK